jgi:hypothetical protein
MSDPWASRSAPSSARQPKKKKLSSGPSIRTKLPISNETTCPPPPDFPCKKKSTQYLDLVLTLTGAFLPIFVILREKEKIE